MLSVDEEKVFLIGEELEFQTGESDGEPSFLWRDPSGDIDEFYEFVATGTNAPTQAFFVTCMYRAMFERKYRRTADSVGDTALEEFIYKYVTCVTVCNNDPTFFRPPPKPKTVVRRKVSKKTEEPPAPSAPSPEPEPIDVDQFEEPASQESQPTASSLPPKTTVLFSEEAELYFWDAAAQGFRNEGIVVAKILQQEDEFNSWLAAASDNGLLLLHRICPEMNQKFSQKMFSVTWNQMEGPQPTSWLFRFNAEGDFANFVQLFSQTMWESLNRMPWGKIKVRLFFFFRGIPFSNHCSQKSSDTSLHRTRMSK